MESNWRYNVYELGMLNWQPFFNTGFVSMCARFVANPQAGVMRMELIGGPFTAFWGVTAAGPTYGITGFPIPQPTTPFPHGYAVEPDS